MNTKKELVYDIQKIINEINISYSNKCYFAAIALSLILPDICYKIEYKNQYSLTVGYKKWCSEWLSQYYVKEGLTDEYIEYWSDAIYQERCSILHNGQNEFKSKKFKNYIVKKFNFIIDIDEPYNNFAVRNISNKTTGYIEKKPNNIEIDISINYFIRIIISGVYNFINSEKYDVNISPQLIISDINIKEGD